ASCEWLQERPQRRRQSPHLRRPLNRLRSTRPAARRVFFRWRFGDNGAIEARVRSRMDANLLTSWDEHDRALQQVLARAEATLCIFDADLVHMKLERAENIAIL